MILLSNFLYAGGPCVLICLILCFAPYFCYSDKWQAPSGNDPINHGLQSIFFQYALVAIVAASTPPLIEISAGIIYSRGNLSTRSLVFFTVLFCLILPELITLNFISPVSNAKLYLCSHNACVILYLFLACMLLCKCSQKFWRNKWSTIAVSCIYTGLAMMVVPPYCRNNLKLYFIYLGSFLQFVGCVIFLVLSIQFLKTKLPDDRNNVHVIADDLICRITTMYIIFVIIGRFTLFFASGLPYWTDCTGVYLSIESLITSAPSIGMCFACSHATRNEAYFTQNVRQKFVRYISHEMRTPLNTAVMGLQYLRSELMKAGKVVDLLGIVDEVSGACEISVTILNEMLDYDKLQSGLMKLEKEEILVKKFLKTTILPFHAQANHKGIFLQADLEDTALNSLQIEVDPNKLAQVIRNLISNALKFTPSGGTVKVVTTVLENQPLRTKKSTAVAIVPNGSKLLRIDVIDSGVGVSKDNQSRLFKEIIQFNPGKLQSGGGSGLGLYISKGIMDLHQGDITIASEGEGFGCTFTIKLQARYNRAFAPSEVSEFKESFNNNINNNNNNNNSNNLLLNTPTKSSYRYMASSMEGVSTRTTFPTLKISPNEIKYDTILTVNQSHIYSEGGGIVQSNSDEYSTLHKQHSRPSSLYKILIVDDSSSNRKMLMRLLKDKGTDIDEAVDGVDAVNKVKHTIVATERKSNRSSNTATTQSPQKFHYDAILMDYVMPNMEGPEAARCMRDLGYTGLIIGITGNMLPVDKNRYLSQGANIILAKPVNIQEINNALQLLETTRTFDSKYIPHSLK